MNPDQPPKHRAYIKANKERFSAIFQLMNDKAPLIPSTDIFSRVCAIRPSPFGETGDIGQFITAYEAGFKNILPSIVKSQLKLSEKSDLHSFYNSKRIIFQLKQTASKVGAKPYKYPKYNTYCFCPFCPFEPPTMTYKPHMIEVVNDDGTLCQLDSNKFFGFYDTGSSGLCHHLADCHGILKSSIMPQPFVGFSRSLRKFNNMYDLAIICPHQHWENDRWVGCNEIFEFDQKKAFDKDDHTFKAYFRHFHSKHDTKPNHAVPSVNQSVSKPNSKSQKHIVTPDNLFIPIHFLAHQETIAYQMKNHKNSRWNDTIEYMDDDEQIMNRELLVLDNSYDYALPTDKEEPSVSHNAVSRSRKSSTSPNSETRTINTLRITKPKPAKKTKTQKALESRVVSEDSTVIQGRSVQIQSDPELLEEQQSIGDFIEDIDIPEFDKLMDEAALNFEKSRADSQTNTSSNDSTPRTTNVTPTFSSSGSASASTTPEVEISGNVDKNTVFKPVEVPNSNDTPVNFEEMILDNIAKFQATGFDYFEDNSNEWLENMLSDR
ncbi:hypothetical protein BN7_236 [Wickerhamomyces ciferrii]|uniref:Transcription regulator Rua1 C-terminal domain-containing protein n=1 Tax=Wickerhamomyces ciferrii (strain ATCC 14091 / BCRC 22168 / CBS 111 / JCM 3599 / NBRC 0793 / NRRL Y-1031 F-60-10) TaxID=1206466 RepID=K0KEQ6_WICCF|nr:uncharacterized protein BN7_236 [Wickerhamomyces ciferrii]CCH40702.1 hypothetical protein BN7_236 [Wickerhamomyces ciferrii]